MLTLLFLLHRENGDFSILMKDIYPLINADCIYKFMILILSLQYQTHHMQELANHFSTKDWCMIYHMENMGCGGLV